MRILGIDPGTNIMGFGILEIINKKANFLAMGLIDLRKTEDPYEKLGIIYQEITKLIKEYNPTSFAIEAPFFGKNVQSMLKLGRAQGVAIAAALANHIDVAEYAPLKVKMSISGTGSASKEQLADLLRRFLNIDKEYLLPHFDATDALAVAYCHYLQMGKPVITKGATSWQSFISNNPNRIKK